jgi:hypothetical protein
MYALPPDQRCRGDRFMPGASPGLICWPSPELGRGTLSNLCLAEQKSFASTQIPCVFRLARIYAAIPRYISRCHLFSRCAVLVPAHSLFVSRATKMEKRDPRQGVEATSMR